MRFERHWQFIGKWFNSSALRLLVGWFALVPIVVKVLEHMPQETKFTIENMSYVLHWELPFRWWLLWLASFVYTIAWVLYVIWVPSIVKRYRNFTSYKQEGHSPRWIVWEIYYEVPMGGVEKQRNFLHAAFRCIFPNTSSKLFKTLVEKKLAAKCCPEVKPLERPLKEPEKTYWTFFYENTLYELKISENDDNVDEAERELFWELYGYLAGSRPIKRGIVILLLLIGSVLILITVLQNICTVLEWIFNRLI